MADLQDGSRVPTAKENFGFTDGISDPAFAGQYEPAEEAVARWSAGASASRTATSWAPLATGEFILGHASEAQELPPSAAPWSFMRNGTFMVYRKLHQNIGSLHQPISTQQAALLHAGRPRPVSEEAAETIMAKMVGRWRSGIPLAVAPTYKDGRRRSRKQWADIPALQAEGRPRRAPRTRRGSPPMSD